ncbi:poly(3-hydroxybutyrate) depolymerase [Humitalea rosea]|uniref:Poly(3-hydroxybutyrate) depolymerase n=1 Tax=Humitalea rosea TaxID=990373 RepID=A0A2W7I9T0_9PROT|nr:polyhydroxyalkanoate depolymerase [Humitalea rosea]PZW43651.1 poly(3-hydroxybutyrate) depolymerase [Humitalea rosea]
MYSLYQAQADFIAPFRTMARSTADMLTSWDSGRPETWALRRTAAALDLFGRMAASHARPPFGIFEVEIGGERVPVREEAAYATPFGTLLHFAKDTVPGQSKVLIAAPMSGHFATLLRETVRTTLVDHDVYVTDWHNARDIDPKDGRFGFDEYTAHIIRFLEEMGPGSHVLAVCQPAVAVLAACALMGEEDNPATPLSAVLMAGPIDTRISPTQVNVLAQSKPMSWFERHLISTVPWRLPGGGRRVYPGTTQLTAFLSMNPDRHINAHRDQFRHLVDGNADEAAAHRKFYDEYLAVMDLPAEFFLETVQRVFQDHDLPEGRMMWRDRLVRPGEIRRTAMMTVEGERDDICAIGQTSAALDLCTALPAKRKHHHLQMGVGHYGVFAGRRWNSQIYPAVRDFMAAAE